MKKNLVPHSFFVKLPVFLTVTLGLIALDWYTISSLFGAFASEDISMIMCGTMALAVAIDVGPMVLGHFLADRLRAKTIAVICTIACVLAFAAAMTGMGLTRIINADTIYHASDISWQEDTDPFAEGDKTTEDTSADNGMKSLNMCTQIIFSLSPFFTSVVAFCLSCLRSQYKLRLDIQKLERHIEELNAEALTIKNSNLINNYEYENENESQRMIDLTQSLAELDSMNQILKQKIRDIYTDHCNGLHWNALIHVHQAQLVPVTASPEYYPQKLTAPAGESFGFKVSLPDSRAEADDPAPDYVSGGEADE